MFDRAANVYATDPDGLANLSDAEQRQWRYERKFLATVTVAPGLTFSDKPCAEFVRADVKAAIAAKVAGEVRTYTHGDRTWTRKVGGRIAANRLHDRLRAFFNWAIEQGYLAESPFDLKTRKSQNRLKHKEYRRNRRLADGEEAGLRAQAGPHLDDVITAALQTAMRIGEILSLQWKQVRLLQNDILLPGPKTKTDKDRKIALSTEMRALLTRRQWAVGRDQRPRGRAPVQVCERALRVRG